MKWTHQALKRRTNLWQTWSESCVMQRRRKSHCFQARPSWLLLRFIAYGPYMTWHTPRFAPFSSRNFLFLDAGSKDVKHYRICLFFSFITFFSLHYQLEKELLLFLALLWRISGSGSWQYLGLKQYETASVQIFSLWCVSPASNGGLGLTTTDVGQILAISGRLSQSRENQRRVAAITEFDDFGPLVDCSVDSCSKRVSTLMLVY
jgi:hypothetical protein